MRSHSLLIPALILCTIFLPGKSAAADETVPVKARIVLVGDSTVASKTGWGDAFAKLLTPGVECLNLGRGGRSSKSYRDEGHWRKVLEAKPTWVLIQFGHNDQPGKGPALETDAKTTFRENLMRYIAEVRQIGANPVLVTSLTRRNFNTQGKIEPERLEPMIDTQANSMPDFLQDYVEATRAVAAEQHVPLIDLNARSVELMNQLGPRAAATFNAKSKNPAHPDKTHLSEYGATETAKLVSGEIRKNVPELAALLRSTVSSTVLRAQAPILPDFYADPSARVFGGKLYVYPSHDAAGARNWKSMVDWHVFSTDDMVKWTDHGVAFGLKDLAWANTEAWAPDCIERNGKYYFYFPAGGQIGVAISDSPTGPFKDALGKPLIKSKEAGIRYMIDPCVFIDDDGQAYLYVGGAGQLGVVKLKTDMITRDGPIRILNMPSFYEGVWVHKRNGIYYASYPTRPPGQKANVMVYSTAKSPVGPFEYRGEILDNHSLNVHGSITEFKGQAYLFYHIEGPSHWERRVCVAPLSYNEDGTINPIIVK